MDEERDQEFFNRIHELEIVTRIYGPGFDLTPVADFAKPLAQNLFKSILHPNFDPRVRTWCLQSTAELCCEMLLKQAGLSAAPDFDTLAAGLSHVSDGRRSVKRKGNLIFDTLKQPGGKCACPIMSGDGSEQAQLMCTFCCGHCRETLFGAALNQSVHVEFRETPVCTGSETCRWLMRIGPRIPATV